MQCGHCTMVNSSNVHPTGNQVLNLGSRARTAEPRKRAAKPRESGDAPRSSNYSTNSRLDYRLSYSPERYQRVKLNNQTFSNWREAPVGGPPGGKLGPWLFFLIMIDDLRSAPIFQLWKYIDDTTLSECI